MLCFLTGKKVKITSDYSNCLI